MEATESKTEVLIYQIKVTLEGSRPPIWRRLLVPANVTLAQLHDIIQIAMGWEGYHLHQFIIGRTYYEEPDPDYGSWMEMRDEHKVTLRQIAPGEGMKFRYEYDFGDSWMHQILVEKILPSEPGKVYPVCIKGKRACPPEDVGGIWGYYNFLEAIQDPEHPEHGDYLKWIGGKFDPEAFDLEKVNRALQALAEKKSRARR